MPDISDLLDELKTQVAKLATERDEAVDRISSVTSELRAAEHEAERLQDELEARKDPEDAIHTFLDECDRDAGSRQFTIPDNPRVHDAIRAMADAIGRNA